jgi:hypothetical protein
MDMSVIQRIRRLDREQWNRLLIGVSGTIIGNSVIFAIGVLLFGIMTGGTYY